MDYSAEIRWFFEGDAPHAMRRWFADGAFMADEPDRTDVYLRLPGSSVTGVKLREGMLEIKSLAAAPQRVTFAPGVDGLRDGWVKWSSAVAGRDALRALTAGSADTWFHVRKRRGLRMFLPVGDDWQEVVADELEHDRLCRIELTHVDVIATRSAGDEVGASAWARSPSWWTLGLEAGGRSAPDDLDRIAARVFRRPPPAKLGPAQSMSYPAWLARLDPAR